MLFSEPKIPQSLRCARHHTRFKVSVLFSEPKIPQSKERAFGNDHRSAFQCSSASRKFLNSRLCSRRSTRVWKISVLFSEPKIPQSSAASPSTPRREISVLFSEPKIPQFLNAATSIFNPFVFQCSSASRKFLNFARSGAGRCPGVHFSALQRAENSSILLQRAERAALRVFQCSSASRKFLN